MKAHFLCLALLLMPIAQGAIYTVTNSNDSGLGSLREAITSANATAAADTINFDTAGHFSVARTITLTSGQLEITKPVTITGPLVFNQRVTISGNDSSRVIKIHSVGTANVTLRHLTIRDGVEDNGAGIHFSGITGTTTTLTMENCTIRDCVGGGTAFAPSGGGLDASYGELVLTNCTFNGNTTTGYGGGLAVYQVDAVLTDCQFTNNLTGDGNQSHGGGGMNVAGESTVTITDSSFTGNSSGTGGGLRVLGTVGSLGVNFTLTRCEFSGNSASDGGGASLLGDGEGVVTDCTFSGNTCTYDGGGAAVTLDTIFTGCTFSGNDASSQGSVLRLSQGGGLWLSQSFVKLVNCTVSGNTAGDLGGGIFVSSNGVHEFLNTTITKNSAPTGGGIFVDTLCLIGNSIIAENTTDASYDVAEGSTGGISSIGHNFIGAATLGGKQKFFDGNNGDQVGTNTFPLLPLLGLLQDNGGPTLTHAPLFGSLVIEAGDSSLVTDPPFAGPAFKDQRGEPRIAVAKVDIGSYEYPALEVTNTNNAGAGSLRDMLAQAQTLGGGVISFSDGVFGATRQTITLTSGQLTTGVDTTIIAPDVGLKISGGNSSRVLNFTGGSSTLTRVIVLDGTSTASGGGIRVIGAATTVLLNDVSVRSSSALTGGGLLIDGSTVTATRCDIISNTATAGAGGGIRVMNSGILNLTNSTISNNSATTDGGGVSHESGQTRLINCTLNENAADSDLDGSGNGGGVFRAAGSVHLGNSIISQNQDKSVSPAEKFWELSGSFTSLGHNLVSRIEGSTGIMDGTLGDQAGVSGAPVDPLLGGSPGDIVFLPANTSPAVDAGDTALLNDVAWRAYPTYDQRGQYRVFNGVVDIGAAEQPINAVVKITVPTAGASEHGPVARKFQLRRSFHANALVVDLMIDPAGTASTGDYAFSGASYVSTGASTLNVTFPAGVDYITLTVTPVDDTAVEGTETLGLILGGTGYGVDSQDSSEATMLILDDEFTVTSAASSGSGTLRKAINDANLAGGGKITIANTLDITLAGNPLVINSETEIIGNATTVSAAGLSRVFKINGDGGGCVKLQGLIITGGYAPLTDDDGGGGVFIDSSCVEIRGCAITGNVAEGDGGGIYQVGDSGELKIVNSAVHSNVSWESGGGIYAGTNGGVLDLTNVTIARNGARANGGGMALLAIFSVSNSMIGCTITENTSNTDQLGFSDGTGGGFYWRIGELLLGNSVIAGNYDTPGNSGTGTLHPDASTDTGTLVVGSGGNFIGDNSGFESVYSPGAPNLSGDYVGTSSAPLDALLLAQEQPRLFYVFPPDSLLTDQGLNALATAVNDQRGRPRIGNGVVDIGAVEMTTFLVTNVNNTGAGSLRSAITSVNSAGAGDVLFSSLFDTSKFITLAGGEITVTGELNLTGPTFSNNGGPLVNIGQIGGGRLFKLAPSSSTVMALRNISMIAGNTSSNAPGDQDGGNILVEADADVTLRNCLITSGSSGIADGGNAHVVAGGIMRAEDCRFIGGIARSGGNVFNAGEIQIKRCYFGDGRASNQGGGLYNKASGALTNCTFSENEAVDDGGGIFNLSSVTLELMNCTLVNNRANTNNNGSDTGGGINRFLGTVSIKNCLIQQNTAGTAADDVNGLVTTLGYNLIGAGFPSGVVPATGDMVGTSAAPLPIAYQELGRFGGRAETFSIGCSSAAFDAGDDSGAPATDQRGLPRIDGNAVDIGAYELQPETYAFWAGYKFTAGAALTGPLDDKDGDGRLNGLEYVFGTHPMVKDICKPLKARRDGTSLTVIASISPLAMPDTYQVRMDTDLQTLDLVPESITVTGCEDDVWLTEFTRDFPTSTKAFGRLEFVAP